MLKACSSLNRGGRQVSRQCGFTTVEILVAVSILAVLITITFVGFKKVSASARTQATRQTLEGLKSLLAEAERNGLYRDVRQPVGVFESDTQWRIRTDVLTVGNNLKPDFWRTPDTRLPTDGMKVPNAAMDEAELPNWRGSRAVLSSALAIALLQTDPQISKSLTGMPEKTRRLAKFFDLTKVYTKGEHVLYADSTTVNTSGPISNGFDVYVKITNSTSAGWNPSDWQQDYAGVLDDWGHPIIYVSPQGLASGPVGTLGNPPATGGTGGVLEGGNVRSAPLKSPDGKGFWMSAGPDGNPATGDDNIYSFEN